MRSKKPRPRRPRRIWLPVGLAVLVLVLAGWLALRGSRPRPAGIPGPLGGPQIAQDVNTLVGQKAPAFRLPDAEGKVYEVIPGQGRPIVVISHMGFY